MAVDPKRALEKLGIVTGPHRAAPASAFRAVRAATGVDLDGELRAMYEAWNGGSVGGVNVYDLEDVAEVNPDLRAGIPFGLFFGDDGGDGSFFMDLDGSLGKEGAVYWTNRGGLVPADSIPVGDSLGDFLESAGRGEKRWQGTSIRDRWIDDMRAAFERHRDRWQSGEIPSASDVMDGLGGATGMPREMHNLQRAVGSPRLPGVGVTILPMDEMTPVEGATDADGDPGAYWFATDDDGMRYAITAIRWRDPDGGRVVRVAPGEEAATAPLIGPMPRVVVDWLEGRKR
jgi:hypothetical protein